ncbi:hypothetical protein MACJ_000978 [Theileria orientalis]|uniref:SfiI-subtelomeric related protein family member n=1 Tax=Theileria orientalis TaxID=68886 RepID=A0A976M6D4_THEOR|nr:hypothetical protein MACJ_000978 [Theileria orientalis]
MGMNIFRFLILCIAAYSVTNSVKCTDERHKDLESPTTTSGENGSTNESRDVNSMDARAENANRLKLTFLDIDCKFCCTFYDYYYNNNSELFQACENIGFESIILGLETIWTKKKEEYVLKVEVTRMYPEKIAMVLHLDNGDVIKLCKDEKNGRWNEELIKAQPDLIEFSHPSEISIITEKCPYPVIHRVNDKTKYDVKIVSEGYYYTFHETTKLIKIKCGGTTLWSRGNTDEQPLTLLYSRRHNKIVMSFYDWTTFYEKIGSRWTTRENSTIPEDIEQHSRTFSERNLKLLTDSSPTKSDPTKYDFEKLDESRCKYRFKTGVKCREVRYSGMIVWTPMTCFSDVPREVYVNKSSKTVTLVGERISVYLYNEMGWNMMYSGTPNGLDLDIAKKKSTNEYDYTHEKETKITLFEAKPISAFKSVRQKSRFRSPCCCPKKVIWEARGLYEFATRVVLVKLGSGTKFLSIYQIDGYWKKFKMTKRGKKWQEIDPFTKIPLYLNLKSVDETMGYNVSIGFTATFTPKEGFAFGGVFQWSGWFSKDNKVIWKASGEKEYSNKVVVEGIGKQTSRVIVHIPEGEPISFRT